MSNHLYVPPKLTWHCPKCGVEWDDYKPPTPCWICGGEAREGVDLSSRRSSSHTWRAELACMEDAM